MRTAWWRFGANAILGRVAGCSSMANRGKSTVNIRWMRCDEPLTAGRDAPGIVATDGHGHDLPVGAIVGGHVGFPWTAEMISLATKYPNVYIDTSAYKVRRYPKELVDYLRTHGRRKVRFGSTHPAWPAKDCLEDFESLTLAEETATLFLFENSARVFKRGDASAGTGERLRRVPDLDTRARVLLVVKGGQWRSTGD